MVFQLHRSRMSKEGGIIVSAGNNRQWVCKSDLTWLQNSIFRVNRYYIVATNTSDCSHKRGQIVATRVRECSHKSFEM